MLPRCTTCATVLYPPRPRCPICVDAPLEWIDVAPRASLLSWSEVSIDGPGGLEAPFTVARARLDGAGDAVMVSNLVGCAVPEIGLPLKITFVVLEGSDFAIPQFTVREYSA
jgi:uncharacterized OB-fold protein